MLRYVGTTAKLEQQIEVAQRYADQLAKDIHERNTDDDEYKHYMEPFKGGTYEQGMIQLKEDEDIAHFPDEIRSGYCHCMTDEAHWLSQASNWRDEYLRTLRCIKTNCIRWLATGSEIFCDEHKGHYAEADDRAA